MVEHPSGTSAEATQLFVHPPGSVISIRVTETAGARAARALGLDALPSTNTTAVSRFGRCLWVRPDEWLATGAEASREAIVEAVTAALGEGGGGVVDISASRIVLELSGPASRDVLASCCPLDLHPRSFPVGRCAQSLVAKAPVLLHLVDETPCWHLYVRPSLVAYVMAWLTDAMPIA